MADATGSPRGTPAPYPTSSLTAPEGLPSAPPPAETTEQREYRPLAILAIAGLGIAVVFALAMVILAGVSLIQKRPLILPGWTVAFPLTGAGLALLGWVRVQRSEGTVGGRKLALASVAICAVVGLVYWSYYLATFLAMRQRADAVCREWMAEVNKGNLDVAYWYTLDPMVRPRMPANPQSDPNFRYGLESRFNAATDTGTMSLSQFERRDEVHLLRQIGSQVQIESLGISDWDYKGEGYVITLAYRVSGSEGAFDMGITLQGKDAKHQEFEGRQWFIEPGKLSIHRDGMILTAQGRRGLGLRMQSGGFLDEWKDKLATESLVDAFLDTRPTAERERLRATLRERSAAIDCMVLAAAPGTPACAALFALRAVISDSQVMGRDVPGFEDFTKGTLVHADRDRFWVTLDGTKKPGDPGYKESVEQEQDKVVNLMKGFFAHPEAEFTQALQVDRGFMPLTHQENGFYYVDIQFALRLDSVSKAIDGVIALETTEEEAGVGAPVNWRIARLELLRVKPITAAASGMPGRPGMRGRGGMRGPPPGGGRGGP